MTASAIRSALLGTAIGDALGLPYEGLGAARAARLLGPPDRYRLLPGRGMVSDDTEHALLTAEALARSGGDPEAFGRALAGQLRLWLLGLPAGVGWATLRAGLRLLVGVPAGRSGVFSAGNGPAMRAAVIGAAVQDAAQLPALIRVSSRLTHTDPKAEYAALAVALAAFHSARGTRETYPTALRALWPGDDAGREVLGLIERAAEHARAGGTLAAFAGEQGWTRGVSGYSLHTVPAALLLWFRHGPELLAALQEAVSCGGDTDTVAAITGGLIGAGGVGAAPEWRTRLLEPGLSEGRLQALAERVEQAIAEGRPAPGPSPVGPARLPRNLLFLAVVLGHGLRRMLPPYR